MSGSHEAALALLNYSQIFDFGDDEFKEAFSKLMTLHEVEEGHIFVKEGEDIKEFYIVDEGVLGRYKLNDTVLIDTVEGKGRVTGFMHSLEPEFMPAFATIKVENGPAKIWTIQGADLRETLLVNPKLSLQLMKRMAFLIRRETKFSRALLKATATETSSDEIKNAKKGKAIRVLCYDTTSWVRNGFVPAIEEFNKTLKASGDTLDEIIMEFTEERLNTKSAAYAAGYNAVCTFVNDTADSDVITTLRMLGVKMIAQRSAGFDRIDTKAALAYGMTVARVPAYSPYAVAEMAVTLLMTVNRRITRANNRVRMANFSLDEGLMGMDIYGKTVGIMGTGKIGAILCNIMKGFGANLICYDVFENDEVKSIGGVYVPKDEIYERSDVIFLMMPLLPPTRHTINMEMLPKLKDNVILINTSRGGLMDTKAVLEGLKSGKIAGVGMDVYENEADYFFQDWSAKHIPDSDLVSLLGNHNVVMTAHQAFFTQEAVSKIISTTLENLRDFARGKTGLDHPNNCIPVPK